MGSKGEPVPYAGVKVSRNSNLPKIAYTISLPFRSVSFHWIETVAKQYRTLVYSFFVVLPPNTYQVLLILEVSVSPTTTHHSR